MCDTLIRMTEKDETAAETPADPEDVGDDYERALLRLNDKQRLFVEEYLVDLNATQAAIRAKYGEKGAHTQGWRLLRNVEVAKAVRLGLADMAERCHLSQAWVREGLKRNVRKAWDKDELPAANRGLQLLGQSLGMFSEDLNVNLNTSEPAKVVMYFPDNGRGPKPRDDKAEEGPTDAGEGGESSS